MENPFKKSTTRLPEFNKTEEKISDLEEKKDKLDFPLGQGDPNEGMGSTITRAIGNGFLSIPNFPASKIKEIQIKLAEMKLERIKNKDEKEAYKLNDKYDALLEEAKISGDSTKLKEFAVKELGMNME